MVSIAKKSNDAAAAANNNNNNNRRRSGSFCFLFCLVATLLIGVLVLDAYEVVSVQMAKDARNTLYTKMKDLDPAIIEQQIGMKILTLDEYNKMVNESAAATQQQYHQTLTSEAAAKHAAEDLDAHRQASLEEKQRLDASLQSMTLERDNLVQQVAALNSEKETLATQLATRTTERDDALLLLQQEQSKLQLQLQLQQQQQQVHVERTVDVVDNDDNSGHHPVVDKECSLHEQSLPEAIVDALFTHNCTLVTCASAALADQIMAFVPNYRYVHRPKQDNSISRSYVELQRDDDYTWLAMDWRQRQGIAFPHKPPAPCHPSQTMGRHLNYYFGSQLFTDMTWLLYSRRPYYRFLDANQETGHHVYLSTLYQEHPDETSATMRDLRRCLKQHGADRTNAIGCLFLPTTDCVLTTATNNNNDNTIPAANQDMVWSTAPTFVHEDIQIRPKEIPLCGEVGKPQEYDAFPDDDNYKNECLRNQVGRAVPVSPILQRSIQPDISKMALFLAGRELEMATPLRAAVDELLREQTSVLTLPCVALHIRRGDKIPECGQGKQESCAFQKNWTDYSDIGLDYLKQLNNDIYRDAPPGGSLFVMTDDAAFLQGKTVPAPYSVVGLAGNTAPDLAHADGLRDLVILMASLELASQCDAVVGNSESEGTFLCMFVVVVHMVMAN
jgi:hypothetical protein